jgi:hypothetical protein
LGTQAATQRQVGKQVESHRLRQMQAGRGMQAGMRKQSRGRQEWRSRQAYMQVHGQPRRNRYADRQLGRHRGRQKWGGGHRHEAARQAAESLRHCLSGSRGGSRRAERSKQ